MCAPSLFCPETVKGRATSTRELLRGCSWLARRAIACAPDVGKEHFEGTTGHLTLAQQILSNSWPKRVCPAVTFLLIVLHPDGPGRTAPLLPWSVCGSQSCASRGLRRGKEYIPRERRGLSTFSRFAPLQSLGRWCHWRRAAPWSRL